MARELNPIMPSNKNATNANLAASAFRVGLIGFGAIGRDVTRILRGSSMPIEMIGLVRNPRLEAGIAQWVHGAGEMIAARPMLVVEAAGHDAVAQHVVPILESGISVVLSSVGALADDVLQKRVIQASQNGKSSFIIPSGAIGALDYIRAVSRSSGLHVKYCSRKPVAAWEKELIARGFSPDALDAAVVLFEGTAREAALAYPQNLNVAMSLALAGPGVEGVNVRVVADPTAAGNTHEIEVESAAGRANFSFQNTPSETNPKTSALTALSIVQVVWERLGMFL